MSRDARFEDGAGDRPLRLKARDEDDLAVLSALLQDSVLLTGDIRFMARHRRLVVLVNRFRWEAAQRRANGHERVRAAFEAEGVMRLHGRGIDRHQRDSVLSLLRVGWDAGADGTGALTLFFAGGAELRAEAEMLEAGLIDLTRPWRARARTAPEHGE